LRGDLPHEVANLLEVRVIGSRRQLAVIPRPDLVQYRRPIRVVLLQVPIQVGLLAETPLAQWTLEWLLLIVDVAHVTLQIAGDAEAPFAVFTLVWLLAGVRPQMSCQIRRSGEHLAAEFARISVLGLQPGLHVDRVRRQA